MSDAETTNWLGEVFDGALIRITAIGPITVKDGKSRIHRPRRVP